MKKLLKITIPILLIALLAYVGYRYFLSGSSSYQSIYLVPENAVFIIETDAAFDAWDNIIHSDAWNKIKYIEYFADLNQDIQKVDSLLSKKKLLLKTIGRRKVTVSLHEFQSGKFDFLYILNIGKAAQARNPEKIISSILGKDFNLTKRNYKDQIIYELRDIERGEMYYFSFVKNKLILSFNYKIVEASIDEMSLMRLGRNLDFIDVSKRISGKGLFDVYISYKYLPDYLRKKLGKTNENILKLKDQLTYSAFSFNILPEGTIALEGYTGVNDSVTSFFTSVMQTGNNGFKSAEVIPARVASLVKISFDDARDYYRQSLSSLDAEEYKSTLENLHKYEKKLKIDLEDDVLDWIGNEIVLLQTQPSNLGRNNEFAAIISAKNKREPERKLDHICEQIEKNFPIKIREVSYRDYTIRYISLPGILKSLFGKMLNKIEKPYYTIIEDYVIFSNHPQTLKNIIDDYYNHNTLISSPDFNNFSRLFDKRSNAYAYFDIPVLYSNMKEFVSYDTWQNLQYNKPYITSFPQAGVQIDNSHDLLHLMIKTAYNENVEEYAPVNFSPESLISLFRDKPDSNQVKNPYENWSSPKIIIHDLDDSEMEEYYPNGELKFTIGLKHGIKHGTYKQYYEDGSLMVKGKYRNDLQDGDWKLYDREGNLIEEKIYDDGKEQEGE